MVSIAVSESFKNICPDFCGAGIHATVKNSALSDALWEEITAYVTNSQGSTLLTRLKNVQEFTQHAWLTRHLVRIRAVTVQPVSNLHAEYCKVRSCTTSIRLLMWSTSCHCTQVTPLPLWTERA